MSQRTDFLNWCVLQLGKPYIWAAKGPNAFDCSGFVTAGYRAVGLRDWRNTHHCQKLFEYLKAKPPPQAGDLIFYGSPSYAMHVMVVWGDGRVIGASGGGSGTTTPTPLGRVKWKDRLDYRPDVIGSRQSPFDLEALHGT